MSFGCRLGTESPKMQAITLQKSKETLHNFMIQYSMIVLPCLFDSLPVSE